MKTKRIIFVLAVLLVALCAVLAGCGEIENGNYTISIKPEGSADSYDYVVSVGDAGGTVAPVPTSNTTYTVLFSAEGGTVSKESVELAAGKSALCPTASREGYVFDGWYASRSGAGEPYVYVTADEATFADSAVLVLYARYTRALNVTYVLGEGDVVTRSVSSADALAPVSRDGYRFLGWYRDAAFTTPALTVEADDVLYARYARLYRLTYVLGGGSFATPPVETGTSSDVIELPTPVRPHFEFFGWTDDSGATRRVLDGLTSDLVLYANWGNAYYTLSWDFGGVECATAVPTAYHAGDAFSLPSPTASGNIFCGWYEGNRLVEAITPSDMGDKTFTARWASSTVTVLADAWSYAGADGATRSTRWSANVNKDIAGTAFACTYDHDDALRSLIAAGRLKATVSATFEVSAQTSGDATLINSATFLVGGSSVGTVTATAKGGGYSGSYFTDPLRNRTYQLGGKVTQCQTVAYALPALGGSLTFGYNYHLETDKANTCFNSVYAYRLVALTITYSLV
ncbi:MAG: InlB B-repeat-containing protein [Clostridia bacterium]|nr:InlB B-repeat-containing protein [Clostridia bacterium]